MNFGKKKARGKCLPSSNEWSCNLSEACVSLLFSSSVSFPYILQRDLEATIYLLFFSRKVRLGNITSEPIDPDEVFKNSLLKDCV